MNQVDRGKGARIRVNRGCLGWVVILSSAALVWLVAGSLRAGDLARAYFATAHGPGATVTNVQIDAASPAVPPFWSVTVSGDVTEEGRTTPSYESHMILWVEPITGIVLGAGSG